jgi:PAP2 superfamily
MTAIHWPPFGYMHEEYEELFLARAIPKGLGLTQHSWDTFLDKHAEALADLIWPRWDEITNDWCSDAARAGMAKLTRQDIDVCVDVHECRCVYPVGNKSHTHKDLFKYEDVGANFETSVRIYLQGLKTGDIGNIITIIVDSLSGAHEPGMLTVIFKGRFRRPRPYAAALLLGASNFKHWLMATSSLHPSFPSGHAFQGLVGVTCGWLQLDKPAQKATAAVAQQLAIDIGDRRVFAGVHYPSDNFASWYLALQMAPLIWPSNSSDAIKFMKQAIAKSQVKKDSKNQIYLPLHKLVA